MDLKCTEVFGDVYEHYQMLSNQQVQENKFTEPKRRYRQIVAYGGSRSSKSWSILQIFVILLSTNKNFKITCWRNEKVTCRSTIMEDFKNILYSDINLYNLFTENKAKGSFTHKKTGSVIIFEGGDSIGKVLGMTQHISFFNEITEFNEDVYLQITQRTSQTIFADYNPSKSFWFEKHRKRNDTIFLHSWYAKNAFCPPEIVQQLESYEPWDRSSYEIIDGEIWCNGKPMDEKNRPKPNVKNISEGTVNEYMWMVYGLGLTAEKPNKIYRGWSRISRENYDLLEYTEYLGLDFGTSNPTAMLGVKFDGEKTFYVDQKLYMPQNEMKKSLNETLIECIGDNWKKIMIVCDSAKKAYGDSLRQAGFFAVDAKKGSGSLSYGISVLKGFKIVFTKESEDIENEYSLYSFMTDRYSKATDEPIKKDDHLMDALRYVITYLVYFLGIKLKK